MEFEFEFLKPLCTPPRGDATAAAALRPSSESLLGAHMEPHTP